MTSDPSLPYSIRLLRRANRLIAALLRSPLHGLLSRDVLLLRYAGARSGRSYALPLSYVVLDGRTYLCTRSSRWWRNLRSTPRVELRLRGQRVGASATVLDPASDEALAGFRAFVEHNPRTGEVLYAVPRGAGDRAHEDDLAREVRRSVVVRLDLDDPRADRRSYSVA